MNANLAGEFKDTGSMLESRYFHCAVTTELGGLVIAGASGIELYNPLSGEWSARALIPVARNTCGAVLLPSGVVLVAGGARPVSHPAPVSSTEIYTLAQANCQRG